MYFKDRAQAGQMLAEKLQAYASQPTAVLALSLGGVQVGEEIAKRLHTSLSLLLTNQISAPDEPSLVLGTINAEGGFAYNNQIPAAQMEEYLDEMRVYLEEEKLHQLYDMASVVGSGGVVDRNKLRDRNVILVSDGFKSGLTVEGAIHFLKPIHINKLIIAVPLILGALLEALTYKCDQVCYLDTPDNLVSVDHYYEDKSRLELKAAIERMQSIESNWI